MVFKPDKNLVLSADCNKTANINVKNLEFKTVFNGDMAYITQLKQQNWKKVLLRRRKLTMQAPTADTTRDHYATIN